MKQSIKEHPGAKGSMVIKIYRGDKLLSTEKIDNLIVNGGKNALANLLGSNGTGKNIAAVGIGDGNAVATATDTGLTNAVTVTLDETRIATGLEAEDGSTFDAANIVQFHFTFPKATAVGLEVKEYGLFCSDGTMFSRIVRGASFIKTDIDSIRGFWQIQF
jgi:hypothetical protein